MLVEEPGDVGILRRSCATCSASRLVEGLDPRVSVARPEGRLDEAGCVEEVVVTDDLDLGSGLDHRVCHEGLSHGAKERKSVPLVLGLAQRDLDLHRVLGAGDDVALPVECRLATCSRVERGAGLPLTAAALLLGVGAGNVDVGRRGRATTTGKLVLLRVDVLRLRATNGNTVEADAGTLAPEVEEAAALPTGHFRHGGVLWWTGGLGTHDRILGWTGLLVLHGALRVVRIDAGVRDAAHCGNLAIVVQ